MNRRSGLKWKLTQLKIRSQIFLRRNGLHVMVIACMVMLGAAAILIFTGQPDEQQKEPVNNSKDQTLSDVLNVEDIEGQNRLSVKPTEAPSAEPSPSPTPSATREPGATPMPDFTPVPTGTPEPAQMVFQPPVDGSIIRVFAINSLIYSETLNQWMTHSGVDIASPKGTDVRCIADGTVDNVYRDDMMGMTVIITHANGMVTVYSNLKEEVPVKIGDVIASRTVIGQIGDTALEECLERSHLHFEIRINGEPVNPAGLILFRQEAN